MGVSFPRDGVNRLSAAADVRIDFGMSSIRAYPRTNAISYASFFEIPATLRACCLRVAPSPLERCGGVSVGQQAHAERSRGFCRGSTWRDHWVAGITLARWLQLVVAGPRDLRVGPLSLSLFYVPSYRLSPSRTLLRVVSHSRLCMLVTINRYSHFYVKARTSCFPF